jgi:hypothetical protein
MPSVSFLGVHTAQFAAMRQHYLEGLGLTIVHETAHAVWFSLDGGAEVHVYAASDDYHAFFGDAPVPGIMVDDYRATELRLSRLGVDWLTATEVAGGRQWRHYRAPDGNVYEIMGPVTDPTGGQGEPAQSEQT